MKKTVMQCRGTFLCRLADVTLSLGTASGATLLMFYCIAQGERVISSLVAWYRVNISIYYIRVGYFC